MDLVTPAAGLRCRDEIRRRVAAMRGVMARLEWADKEETLILLGQMRMEMIGIQLEHERLEQWRRMASVMADSGDGRLRAAGEAGK